MEDELKCSYCNDFYCNPVLLPCYHSLCYTCALQLQEKFNSTGSLAGSNGSSHTRNGSTVTLNYSHNDISNNISAAIANAAKSASQMIALSKPDMITSSPMTPCSTTSSSSNTSSSMSPQSSISSSSSINMDNMCRTLSITDLRSSIVSDLDKLSVFSETDSGVHVGAGANTSSNSSSSSSTSSSRPCSYISQSLSQCSPAPRLKQTQSQPPVLPIFNTSPLYSIYLPCPSCNTMIYMPETGVDSLTKNTCLENIVERYTESKRLTIKCQMCPSVYTNGNDCTNSSERDAVYMCEQCQIYYCEACRESCHPMRGPLLKHNLVAPKYGRELSQRINRIKESKCSDHINECVSLYCLICKCSCCNLCVTESVHHINHQTQPINSYCKSQKAQLTEILKSLSLKTKSTTEFVTNLNNLPEIIEDNSTQLKTIMISEIDEMIRLLDMKKKELIDFIDVEKASKIKSISEQASFLSSKIRKTNGLLGFCVESLKEKDPSSFLQISEHLIEKMSDIENKFPQEMDLEPKIDLDFDFVLNKDIIYKEIKKLQFKQIKVPKAPSFVVEECQNESNDSTIILSWNQKVTSKINQQGYVLEMDDGTIDGPFKQVYCGGDRMCRIDGLVPNCVYNARVKSFNQAGYSDYSHVLSISSTPTLWFFLNPKTSHSDVLISNNQMSATCISMDGRVVLGSVGFSKGVHYWEVTIDRYDNQPDPAFGVARYDVAKDHILGKDNKSWCMYIDSSRSWFTHNGIHARRVENGIQQGCVIGVLLDLNKHTLSYFVNDEPHGSSVAFKLPEGVYYPAFSLNKDVQITLSSGLEPPPCLDTSDSD